MFEVHKLGVSGAARVYKSAEENRKSARSYDKGDQLASFGLVPLYHLVLPWSFAVYISPTAAIELTILGTH